MRAQIQQNGREVRIRRHGNGCCYSGRIIRVVAAEVCARGETSDERRGGRSDPLGTIEATDLFRGRQEVYVYLLAFL